MLLPVESNECQIHCTLVDEIHQTETNSRYRGPRRALCRF